MSPTLTRRQHDVLKAVLDLSAHGAVTVSRLADHLGLPRQNTRTYAKALHAAGLVTYQASERHTAIVTPTVAGHIHAGRAAPTAAPDLTLSPGDYLLPESVPCPADLTLHPGERAVIRPAAPGAAEYVLVRLPGSDQPMLLRAEGHLAGMLRPAPPSEQGAHHHA